MAGAKPPKWARYDDAAERMLIALLSHLSRSMYLSQEYMAAMRRLADECEAAAGTGTPCTSACVGPLDVIAHNPAGYANRIDGIWKRCQNNHRMVMQQFGH